MESVWQWSEDVFSIIAKNRDLEGCFSIQMARMGISRAPTPHYLPQRQMLAQQSNVVPTTWELTLLNVGPTNILRVNVDRSWTNKHFPWSCRWTLEQRWPQHICSNVLQPKAGPKNIFFYFVLMIFAQHSLKYLHLILNQYFLRVAQSSFRSKLRF